MKPKGRQLNEEELAEYEQVWKDIDDSIERVYKGTTLCYTKSNKPKRRTR